VTDERARVWVVDDQASFRRATTAALHASNDFVLVGESETGEAAVELIQEGGVDIVLMDINMPGMGGIAATREILSVRPDLTIVLMSTYDAEDLPAAAWQCGAGGYVRKDRLSSDLLSRLWRAAG